MEDKIYQAVTQVSRCPQHISFKTGIPWEKVAEVLDRLHDQGKVIKNVKIDAGAVSYRKTKNKNQCN